MAVCHPTEDHGYLCFTECKYVILLIVYQYFVVVKFTFQIPLFH
jgi:hypothetical protein